MSAANGTATSWQTKRLGNLAQVKGGKRLPKGEKLLSVPTPFPYIRVCDFNAFSVDQSDLQYLTPEIQKTISRYIINKEDVFISIAGTIGRVGTIPETLDGANLTENAARIVLNKDENLDKEFLKYCLASPEIQNDIASRRSKNAQPKLALAQIKDLELPLPPLPEQKKIAHILSTVQRAIEVQERIIQITTELKKALMHKLFTEGLRNEPQKQTEIGLVPESWDVVPLINVIRSNLQNGAFVKKPEAGKGFLFANVVDMYRETHLDLSRLERLDVHADSISQYWLEDGDILVVRSSLKREGIGQNCVARNLRESVFYDCHLIRVQTDSHKLIPEFLSNFWRSDVGKNDLVLRSKTTTMTTINQQGISKALVPIPSIEEQSEIVDVLETVDMKNRVHWAQKTHLEDLFRTLIHELMTAKTRVNELEFPKMEATTA